MCSEASFTTTTGLLRRPVSLWGSNFRTIRAFQIPQDSEFRPLRRRRDLADRVYKNIVILSDSFVTHKSTPISTIAHNTNGYGK